MESEKQRQQSILDSINPALRLVWVLLGIVRLVRAAFPRRRVWRYVRVLRHPLIIGLNLALLAFAYHAGQLHVRELAAGGLTGAAAGLFFWDEL